MLKRPKSAVLLSLPYNFQNKQQAVDIKQKVKKSLLTFETDESLNMDLYQENRKISCRSYIDNGPSLLNNSTHHYTVAQQGRTFRSMQQSRATSAGFTKRNSRQKCTASTGLENYQRLKPCKVIDSKTIQNLEDCLNNARKESKFMERIFENISPSKHLIKKGRRQMSRNFPSRIEKENKLEVKGHNLTIFQDMNMEGNKYFEDSPFKTNVFQPILQRKGLQLLRKTKAFLMAR